MGLIIKAGTVFAVLATAATAVHAKDLTKNEVPAAVLEAFESKYPSVVVEKYDFDDDDNVFEIDAQKGTLEIEAKFRKDGTLVESKEDVRAQDLPVAVLNQIKEKYPKAKVLGANRVFKDGEHFWDVGIKVRGRHRNVIISQ